MEFPTHLKPFQNIVIWFVDCWMAHCDVIVVSMTNTKTQVKNWHKVKKTPIIIDFIMTDTINKSYLKINMESNKYVY